MAYITKEYLENNIKNYDQYRKLDKEGQANGLATLDANGKLVSTQIPSGVGAATYNGSPVTSIVAGSNTAMSLTNGALTIASTASGSGNVPAYTSADAHKPLVVNHLGTGTEWGSCPFYEEDTNDPFILTIEDYTVDGVAKKGLSITCPSNVAFAQLDCAMNADGINVLTPIKSTKVSGKQTISIMNSCPSAGFDPEATYRTYLRFTTKNKKNGAGDIIEKGHTYNAAIVVSYNWIEYTYQIDTYF